MPNLINNPDSQLAQNYRRVRVSDSNLGTRRIQFYNIYLYEITDLELNALQSAAIRTVADEGSNDSEDAYEFKSATILEATLRGVQRVAEVYIVGDWDYEDTGSNKNTIMITVGVSADTVDSGWEQYINNYYSDSQQNSNFNADDITNSVGDAVDQYVSGDWDGVDVVPVSLRGDYFDSYGPGFALGRNANEANSLRAARFAKIDAARNLPRKFKRPE